MVAVLTRALAALALLAGCLGGGVPAYAEPTPPMRFVDWDAVAGVDGYYLYVAPDTPGHTYSNTRRYQIPNAVATSTVLVDLTGPVAGRLCLVMTAYLGPDESAYSNEVCEWFGMSGTTIRVRP